MRGKSTTITFGPEEALVTIPASYAAAASSKADVSFSRVVPENPGDPDNRAALAPVTRYFHPLTGEEVPADAIRKGYKLGKDRFVLIDDSTVAEITDRYKLESVEVVEFIDASKVDATRVKDIHYLQGQKPYPATGLALLLAGMKATKTAAVVRFSAGTRQRLGVLMPRTSDGVGVILTLHYAEDIKTPDAEVLAPTEMEINKAAVKQVKDLILRLKGDGSALDTLTDEAREERVALVETALSGAPLPEAKPAKAPAIMADITAMLDGALAAASAGKAPAKKKVAA